MVKSASDRSTSSTTDPLGADGKFAPEDRDLRPRDDVSIIIRGQMPLAEAEAKLPNGDEGQTNNNKDTLKTNEEGVADRSSVVSVGTELAPNGPTSDAPGGDSSGSQAARPDSTSSGTGPSGLTSGSDQAMDTIIEIIHPSCEGQINNLVDMAQIKVFADAAEARKKLVAVAALQEWKEAQTGLQGKVERRTKQADKLLNEIYQLVGLYSVFVGVVFTAAVQSQTLKCQHVWSPLLLCAFAWLTILLVTKKRLKTYVHLRGTIKSEEKSRAAIYDQITKLKGFGHREFDFTEHVDENRPIKTLTKDSKSGVIQFVLTALTLILAGSFVQIMCLKEITSKL